MLLRTFYTCHNNGVTAVVTEEVYKRIQERGELLAECKGKGLPCPQLPPITPIFTFGLTGHHSFMFFTGSLELKEKLLEGHDVKHESFWVPFSNGNEWACRYKPELAEWEWQFLTSADQVIEAFGLVIPE